MSTTVSVPKPESTSVQLNQLASTPYPAWLLSTSLLYKGVTNKPVAFNGGLYKLHQQLAKPSRASCFTFGLTSLLGGWIIYDGDVTDGAGFTFAWSTLYVLVNGTSSVKNVVRGRIAPLGFSMLALGNAAIYGKKFFWP